MWVNLNHDEPVVNLGLEHFDDFENDAWEYIFWNENVHERAEAEQMKQSILFSDSAGNLHDSAKRGPQNSAGRGFKKKGTLNFSKKETQKSEFSNLVGPGGRESPRLPPLSRNPTFLRQNMTKKSSNPCFSSQSIQDLEDVREVEAEEQPRQDSVESASESARSGSGKPGFGSKSKNLARVLNENQKRELRKVNKSVDEFLCLMENPNSWVSKLEIDYKDYARGGAD